MKLVPETSPLPRLLVFPFLVLLIVGYVLARNASQLLYNLAHCPLRDITGIPCLTCGATHAFVALSHGRVVEALQANALTTLTIIGVLAWASYSITATMVPSLRQSLSLTQREKKTASILTALILVIAWVWQFRPGEYFDY